MAVVKPESTTPKRGSDWKTNKHTGQVMTGYSWWFWSLFHPLKSLMQSLGWIGGGLTALFVLGVTAKLLGVVTGNDAGTPEQFSTNPVQMGRWAVSPIAPKARQGAEMYQQGVTTIEVPITDIRELYRQPEEPKSQIQEEQ